MKKQFHLLCFSSYAREAQFFLPFSLPLPLYKGNKSRYTTIKVPLSRMFIVLFNVLNQLIFWNSFATTFRNGINIYYIKWAESTWFQIAILGTCMLCSDGLLFFSRIVLFMNCSFLGWEEGKKLSYYLNRIKFIDCINQPVVSRFYQKLNLF